MFSERVGKGTLGGKSSSVTDVGDRKGGHGQELRGLVKPGLEQELVGGNTRHVTEHFVEAADTQAGHTGKVAYRYLALNILHDVTADRVWADGMAVLANLPAFVQAFCHAVQDACPHVPLHILIIRRAIELSRHELNQPLAAMKTYLAGAKLLMRRNRTEEAQAAFSRIDDLIERMGGITRQLKSYARKGQEAFSPVNMGDALASSLSMMEPQLKSRKVKITKILPEDRVLVMGDRMRIEQVMINLLRNALDATKTVSDPQLEIILASGETATLTIRDNGHGIEDLDALFEPFYTTKQPGDGVGLGLAISSGIVNDLGGRLLARNAEGGGAVFEMQLPILNDQTQAAE